MNDTLFVVGRSEIRERIKKRHSIDFVGKACSNPECDQELTEDNLGRAFMKDGEFYAVCEDCDVYSNEYIVERSEEAD